MKRNNEETNEKEKEKITETRITKTEDQVQ